MSAPLWSFTDNNGSFVSSHAQSFRELYLPLANERIMSSVSPTLHGDIKTGQHAFLLPPVSRIDLTNLKSSRNFWVYLKSDNVWSATGVSKSIAQQKNERSQVQAGLLWHKVERENKKIGLRAEITSFVPVDNEPAEIMQVTLTNISSRSISFIPIAAIPIYARSADNIRDHRHVTSLLQRIRLHRFGVVVKPTLLFDETGHHPNKDIYFVLGWEQNHRPPQFCYPTYEMFCGDAGDLEAPQGVLENRSSTHAQIQGREAMGALRFAKTTLTPNLSRTYIVVMGIARQEKEISAIVERFGSVQKAQSTLLAVRKHWLAVSENINVLTHDAIFDNWFRWVSVQPSLRRIFGCSFLPDFDYGRGGRGWRDLWQDCLGLILNEPEKVRGLLLNNFSGARIDGSNATIIGKKPGEFISDRNNISRVWMDHGVWPLLTLELHINETGDNKILFEKAPYFCDRHIYRSQAINPAWQAQRAFVLRTRAGGVYKGTILEHLLVQNLVQFFNVGSHNHVRLEGADWNDGLDMARQHGESVAFSCMYARNLEILCELLMGCGVSRVELCEELKILLRRVNYGDISSKQELLAEYFSRTKDTISGRQICIDASSLAEDLKAKSEWMKQHIRRREWLKEGFFNGYYDNKKKRVEGRQGNVLRMMLASQVFPIMSGVATRQQIRSIWKSIKAHLFDKKLKGFHLNADFGGQQLDLGRAFSFVYGDKENGAFFNHMIVMLAYALYTQGFISEGWQVLSSVYRMSVDTEKSKIYPCLPEYFNAQGRGMYSYLTGSASWFVLTLLTQTFGIRGQAGDLLIEPKLCREQFSNSRKITLSRIFAGRRFAVNFCCNKKPKSSRMQILKADLNKAPLKITDSYKVLISRSLLARLPKGRENIINVHMG